MKNGRKLVLLLLIFLLFPNQKIFAQQIILTPQEQSYLESLGTLKIAFIDGIAPIQYTNSQGEIKGISISVMNEIANILDLDLEYQNYASVNEVYANHYDIALSTAPNYAGENMILSVPYLKSELVMYYNKKYQLSELPDKRCAIVKGGKIPEGVDENNVVYFNNRKDALDGVEDGKADYGHSNAYSLAFYDFQRNYRNISYVPLSEGGREYSLGLKAEAGEFLPILNKAINAIDKNRMNTLILENLSSGERSIDFLDIIEQYHLQLIILLVLIILFFILFALTVYVSRLKHKSLVESERSKSVILSHLPGAAYRLKNDSNRTLQFISEGCYELTGYRAEEFLEDDSVSFYDLTSPNDREMARLEWTKAIAQKRSFRAEYEITTKTNQSKWVLELGQGIYDEAGNVEALEGIILDVTERKLKEYQIEDLKEHDLLTGLYNRSFMEKEIIRLEQAKMLPLSLALCDINGLRLVNDAYGYSEGDQLIIKTAKLIESCLAGDYVLGHLGSGRFLIYLPFLAEQGMWELKLAIQDKIATYNRANRNKLYAISLSIGYGVQETAQQASNEAFKDAEKHLHRRKLLNQKSFHSEIVSSIMATLYAKSQETEEHGQRLGKFCTLIGKNLNLSQADLDSLELLSKLHDIGKIGIDDFILNKPGKLNQDEWKIMKQHPEIGYQITRATPSLEHISKYILYHHERWDGKGYPRGLKKREIPLISRILAVADAYDAMTEDRIYRKALPKEKAIREIEQNAGTQFDPYIAKLFVSILRGANPV